MKAITMLLLLLLILPGQHAADIPVSLGVNIHFTGAPAVHLDMIQAAGFGFVRMDMFWHICEPQVGVYDFSPYDQLVQGLSQRGLSALFILDYNNPLYGENLCSIRTQTGRDGFARFAAQAVAHFQGADIAWEIWNEPNIHWFWQPEPDAGQYMLLLQAAAEAMRAVDPDVTILAPAVSCVDYDFIVSCGQLGLFDHIDALSVHPYECTHPEQFRLLRHMLRQVLAAQFPQHTGIPLVSSEWGYSTYTSGVSDTVQAQYLARMFISNISMDIPSVWYDWRDDGPNPANPEHNFGVVEYDRTPKPAYYAMQGLTKALQGLHFEQQLPARPQDFILLFTGDSRQVVVAWTLGKAHYVQIAPGIPMFVSAMPAYIRLTQPYASSAISE